MKQQSVFLDRIVCVVLILCFAFILFNTTFNGHLHKQNNGLLIFHSHPFEQSSGTGASGSHHHNRTELFVFFIVTLLLEIVQIVLFVFCIYTALKIIHFARHYRLPMHPLLMLPLLRAPPVIRIPA